MLTYRASMKERWRLVVEGLGKIERAAVEIHPLMLLVGPNNTGKNYLATVFWGLVAMQLDLAPPPGPALQACDEWIGRHIVEGGRSASHELNAEEIALFDRLFESTLQANQDQLVSRIFNSESVKVRHLEFRNVSQGRRARFEWAAAEQPGTHKLAVHDGLGDDERSIKTDLRADDLESVRIAARDLLMRRLTFARMTRLFQPFQDTFSRIDPIFLPASRTGFVQLYKAATRQIMRGAYRRVDDEGDLLDLTAPAFHFVDMLAFGLKEKRAPAFAAEADLLEGALKGQVELVTGSATNDFRYKPGGAHAALSMSRSSSLVTELAPLVLVLRHLSSFPVLILEEPEAHLHPELQRRIAQVIVRLIRKGRHVWITTHSENLCQQINNFLELGALAQDRRGNAQQQLGYGEQDYLLLDEVGGYEFRLDPAGERSSVVEMKKTARGIVMPTFNTMLLRLGDEVERLDQLLAEE